MKQLIGQKMLYITLGVMAKSSLLTKGQLLAVIGYSAIFPLTNLAGEGIALVGIAITIPFLPIAWIGGMLFVSQVGSECAYLIGAFLTIFLQVWLLVALWVTVRHQLKT